MNNSIIKNTFYKLVIDILRLLLPVISMPYVYRIFNPTIMGDIEFARSISGYFFLLAGFGVFTYGLREVSRVRNNYEKRNKLFTELFLISTGSSFVLFCLYLAYIHIKFNNDIIIKNMLLFNGIQIISYIFYIDWINEAFEDYNFIYKKTLIIKLINLGCIFIFIKTSDHYYRYLFILNIFIFLNNIISFIYIKKYIKFDFSDLQFKKYFSPLLMICIMANANALYTTLDRILLGFYGHNLSQIAYYSISQNIMLILKTMLMATTIVSVPRLSFYLGQNQKIRYEEVLNKIISFVFILIFPVSIGLIVLSKEIVFFFGGIKYLPGETLLMIFSVRLIIVVIQGIMTNQVIFLNQKEKIVAFLTMGCGLINILMKSLLININFLNAWTAIITTTISEIIGLILAFLYIQKYLKYNIVIFKIEYLKYLLISLNFIPIAYFIKKLDLHYIITIFIIFILCAIIYIFLLFVTKDKYFCLIIKKINLKNFFIKGGK